jgi:hypothetical protein
MHPITKQLETFWADHGGRHDHPEWIRYVNDFGTLLIDKLVEMSEEHDNEGRFGMSKAGGCTRAVALKYLGHDSAQLTGSTRSTFAIGHMLEVMAIATLRACGYHVTGMQDRVTIDPFMSSASDGIVVIDDLRHVLSVKSMGYKMSGKRYAKGGVTWTTHGFAAVAANGFRAEQPGHYAQIQAEMHASGIKRGLMLYVAKDMVKAMEEHPSLIESGSLTFYAEAVEYDEAFVVNQLLPVWGYAWDLAQNGIATDPMYYTKAGVFVSLDPSDAKGNKEKTGTFDPCSYCDLRHACTVAEPLARSLREDVA